MVIAPLPSKGIGKVKPQKRPQRKPEKVKQAPIQFRDAVGRKFVFPYEMVATWPGLERLVREAFMPIAVIGPHVDEGHYDLIGPDGDVILPSVWEHVVVPGMSVTMHMWPLPEATEQPAEDEETRAEKAAAKAAAEAAEAAARRPVRARLEADDPRWIPPPMVAPDGGFGFPDSVGMANGTHSLYLALFELRFDDNIQNAQVTASCDLSPTTDGEADAEWKLGFFRRSSTGLVDGDVLDGSGFDKTGVQQILLGMNDSEKYGVAILLRRRRTEQEAPFPVVFDIDYTHHGDYAEAELVTQHILPGRSESTPWTPLSWAAANGWEDCVNVLLQEKGIAQLDQNGRSALSWSAGGGQARVTKLLCDEPGIQVDEADIGGRTPLSWAAENGHVNTINLLLAQAKVDMNRPDCQGRIPLSWAAGNGHVDAVITLISNAKKNGLIVTAPTGEKRDFDSSPLFWAAKNEQESTLRILMEEELQLPEIYRQPTRLPLTQLYLHKAAQQGWCVFTKLLIEKKVQIDSSDPDYDDRTPLCVAAEQGRAEVVETLLKAGAARNHQTTKARDTPLGLAIRSGHEAAVKVLLNAGASVHLRNAKGEAPRDLANHHPTLFYMVAAVDKVGRLAETEDEHLDSSIDHEFKATVIDFVSVSGVLTPCAVEIAVDELLQTPWVSTTPGTSSTSFRWLHLPVNNLLMARLYNNSASAYRVLKPERWVNRQHHGATGGHHARFMRSQCQAFPSAALWALDGEGTDYHTDLVLFMPFLHWDFEEMHSRREAIANSLSQKHNMNERLTRDQTLVKAYLTDEHPLHIRRTLDQYYYHTATDTTMRDEDQVLGYYQMKNGLQPKILTMVDQLWLWVLKGEQGKPDTVVSCFPVLDPAHPDQQGLTNVLRCVKLRLLDEPASVQTAYDLAGLIAAMCSRIYLDRASTLSFENTKSTLQFSELYETEISHIIQEESVLFGNFTKLEKENVANIQREIVLLSRIKATLDELNVMAMLFNDQRNMLKSMDSIVKFISALETADQSLETADSEDESSSISDATANPDKIAKIEEAYAGQRATVIWGTRNDPDDFSLPLAMVNASIDEINAMLERAGRASQSINFLIDVKLKQNSVMDAQESLKMTRETTKHGRTILIFTLTTIVFLPLSFMTTFFTLDISQFRKNAEGKLDLGYVSYIVLLWYRAMAFGRSRMSPGSLVSEVYNSMMDKREIFPFIEDPFTREEIKSQILQLQGRILFFYTFFDDWKYLGVLVKSVQPFLISAINGSLRDEFFLHFKSNQASRGTIKTQTAEPDIESAVQRRCTSCTSPDRRLETHTSLVALFSTLGPHYRSVSSIFAYFGSSKLREVAAWASLAGSRAYYCPPASSDVPPALSHGPTLVLNTHAVGLSSPPPLVPRDLAFRHGFPPGAEGH
ncbi:uncharacterized protein N7482_000548 [Penicillium canariense]|uniref:Ubiquitin-like domain-containing protein n=1 Tax=Penicillium canariense TaxID=189055 RepID=A0A9W9II31_9EURO|nr:uncharacterized protein N7482_000548 [Penicillium canariense]KAJ5174671.1 hypothetical protein N7482_000548 [Penicillium canariense]